MKKIIVFSFLVFSFLLLASPTMALEDEVRRLIVDLKAKGFTQTEWSDNLNSDQIIFAPGDKFQIQLNIKNEGNRNQTQVVVREALPLSVSTDVPAIFTIPQISAGETYTKYITATIKDKSVIVKTLASNSLRFTAKSEVGTESGDILSFFTSNGIKGAVTSTSSSVNLPATGSNSLVFGSIIVGALAFIALKLRKLARGF